MALWLAVRALILCPGAERQLQLCALTRGTGSGEGVPQFRCKFSRRKYEQNQFLRITSYELGHFSFQKPFDIIIVWGKKKKCI